MTIDDASDFFDEDEFAIRVTFSRDSSNFLVQVEHNVEAEVDGEYQSELTTLTVARANVGTLVDGEFFTDEDSSDVYTFIHLISDDGGMITILVDYNPGG